MSNLIDFYTRAALGADAAQVPEVERLEWLLDAAPVAIYVCDRSGLIVRYNRRAAELWGRAPRLRDPRERYCGSLRMYRLDGALLLHAMCPMAEALRNGASFRNEEVVVERPDGSRAIVSVSVEALRDANGEITGAMNCFQDITDRRQLPEPERTDQQDHQRRAAAHLRSSEQRSLDILEGLPIAVYTTDAEGRITFFNRAAAQLWEHTPELGKSQWCGSWRLCWPDGTPMRHEDCPMALALKENRPIRGAEAMLERPDGTRVPFLAYPTPLRGEHAELLGAMNAMVDITECKRNEDLTQRLAAIVASSQDAIVSQDLNGVVLSWNAGAEQLFGYAAAEMIGRPIAALIPPERREEEPQILERLARGERVEHYETVRLRKDGSAVEISLAVSPLRNAGGRMMGISKVARDIGERRRAQQQQELLLKEMAHRVKNLFALVGGMIALSRRSARSPRELAESLQARLVALARAHDLTLRQVDSSLYRADRTTTLHALLEAIVSPHAELGEAPGARVAASGPQVTLAGSAVTSFALLLHELTTNAVKHGALSTPQGCIQVHWSVGNEELHLTWNESGGPSITAPARSEGFGSLLANQTVTGQFQGRIDRDWKPQGLTVQLSARLERLDASVH